MVTFNPSIQTGQKPELSYEFLKARLEQCPTVITNMLNNPLKLTRDRTFDSTHFVVTGTGSSESHAKFFTYLINNYSRAFAEFNRLSAFSENIIPETQDKTLVIFSQGLSPNAQLALARYPQFRHTILFTSTTVNGASKAGKKAQAEILQRLLKAGNEVVYFPIEDEYTVLIRLIGPLAGYLICLQFLENFSSGRLPECGTAQLLASLENAALLSTDAPTQAILSEGRKGIHLLSIAPFSDFGQNLAYKFLEGLYWPMPSFWDYLQFSHGPFQQWQIDKSPIIILHGDTRTEEDYLERILKMLNPQSVPLWIIKSNLPTCYRILQYEMVLNYFIVHAINELKVNQIDWPGKGLDGPLYEISQPLMV